MASYCRWFKDLVRKGFPRKPNELQDAVSQIVKGTDRETAFADDRIVRRWLTLFMKRHLSPRTAESINKARACITEPFIRKWFDDLVEYLTEINFTEVLQHPTRVFNADEAGF